MCMLSLQYNDRENQSSFDLYSPVILQMSNDRRLVTDAVAVEIIDAHDSSLQNSDLATDEAKLRLWDTEEQARLTHSDGSAHRTFPQSHALNRAWPVSAPLGLTRTY